MLFFIGFLSGGAILQVVIKIREKRAQRAYERLLVSILPSEAELMEKKECIRKQEEETEKRMIESIHRRKEEEALIKTTVDHMLGYNVEENINQFSNIAKLSDDTVIQKLEEKEEKVKLDMRHIVREILTATDDTLIKKRKMSRLVDIHEHGGDVLSLDNRDECIIL